MPNALERATAQRNLATAATKSNTDRAGLIARLKTLDEDAVVAAVKRLELPTTTSKWTTEQLAEVVTSIENGTSANEPAAEETPAPKGGAAKKGAAKKAAPAQTAEAPASTAPRFAVVTKGTDLIRVIALDGDAKPKNPGPGRVNTVVSTQAEVADLATEVQTAIFNAGKETPATKFASPKALAEGAFRNLATAAERTAAPAPAAKAAAKKAGGNAAPRPRKAVDLQPKAKDVIRQVRAGSKVSLLIDLLARPEGATLAQIETELSKTGRPINARTWLGYDLNSVTGYGAKEDADGVIRLVLPKGMTKPLPHKTLEEKAAAPATKTAAKKGAAKKAAPEPETPATAEVTEGNVQVEEVQVVGEAEPEPETRTPAPAAKKGAAKKGAAKKGGK